MAAGKYRSLGYYLSEGSLDRVVCTSLSGDAPCRYEVPSMDDGVVSGWGRDADPPEFAADLAGKLRSIQQSLSSSEVLMRVTAKSPNLD